MRAVNSPARVCCSRKGCIWSKGTLLCECAQQDGFGPVSARVPYRRNLVSAGQRRGGRNPILSSLCTVGAEDGPPPQHPGMKENHFLGSRDRNQMALVDLCCTPPRLPFAVKVVGCGREGKHASAALAVM